MNRLAPLVARRTRVPARFPSYTAPAQASMADESGLGGDARMFVTSLAGGLVFFSTLIA